MDRGDLRIDVLLSLIAVRFILAGVIVARTVIVTIVVIIIVVLVLVALFCGKFIRVRPCQVTKVKLSRNTVYQDLCRLVFRIRVRLRAFLGTSKPSPQSFFMGDLVQVMPVYHLVYFFHDPCPIFIPGRQHSLEYHLAVFSAKIGCTNALANHGEKSLDPFHEVVKKIMTLGMDFVHKRVKRLFVSIHEINECLDGRRGVRLRD